MKSGGMKVINYEVEGLLWPPVQPPDPFPKARDDQHHGAFSFRPSTNHPSTYLFMICNVFIFYRLLSSRDAGVGGENTLSKSPGHE